MNTETVAKLEQLMILLKETNELLISDTNVVDGLEEQIRENTKTLNEVRQRKEKRTQTLMKLHTEMRKTMNETVPQPTLRPQPLKRSGLEVLVHASEKCERQSKTTRTESESQAPIYKANVEEHKKVRGCVYQTNRYRSCGREVVHGRTMCLIHLDEKGVVVTPVAPKKADGRMTLGYYVYMYLQKKVMSKPQKFSDFIQSMVNDEEFKRDCNSGMYGHNFRNTVHSSLNERFRRRELREEQPGEILTERVGGEIYFWRV